jgi:hypothetical protein
MCVCVRACVAEDNHDLDAMGFAPFGEVAHARARARMQMHLRMHMHARMGTRAWARAHTHARARTYTRARTLALTNARTHTRARTLALTNARTHTRARTRAHAHARSHMQTCALAHARAPCACKHSSAHAHAHTYMPTRAHTRTHADTHKRARARARTRANARVHTHTRGTSGRGAAQVLGDGMSAVRAVFAVGERPDQDRIQARLPRGATRRKGAAPPRVASLFVCLSAMRQREGDAYLASAFPQLSVIRSVTLDAGAGAAHADAAHAGAAHADAAHADAAHADAAHADAAHPDGAFNLPAVVPVSGAGAAKVMRVRVRARTHTGVCDAALPPGRRGRADAVSHRRVLLLPHAAHRPAPPRRIRQVHPAPSEWCRTRADVAGSVAGPRGLGAQ